MSDPMTNLGADDVLASIRRLVAETHGQSEAGRGAATRRDTPSVGRKSAPRPDVLDMLQEAMMRSRDEAQSSGNGDAADPRRAPEQVANRTGEVAPAEALVLTPDFRVAQRAAKAAKSQDISQEAPLCEDAGSEETPSEATPAPLILSPDQAVQFPDMNSGGASDTDAESVEAEDRREPLVLGAAEATDPLSHIVSEVVTELAETATDEATAESWAQQPLNDTPDAEAAAYAARLTLEQRIAELEAAVGAQGAQGGEWEPDGSEDLEAEIPREVPRAFADPEGRVSSPLSDDASAPETASDDEAGAEETAETLASSAAAVDAAEGLSGEISEPPEQTAAPLDELDDGAVQAAETAEEEAGEMSADTEAEPVDAEAEQPRVQGVKEMLAAGARGAQEAAADPRPSTEETAAPDLDLNFEEDLAPAGYPDDAIMEDDALRDLVAQVIREELQGEMGERITRNLRRLVRREVQRALTLREFE